MKKQSLFFVPGIILIGVSLRTPFTVLPIILGDISQGLGVEVSFAWCLDQPSSPHVYPLLALFYPTGSENWLGASLHL